MPPQARPMEAERGKWPRRQSPDFSRSAAIRGPALAGGPDGVSGGKKNKKWMPCNAHMYAPGTMQPQGPGVRTAVMVCSPLEAPR